MRPPSESRKDALWNQFLISIEQRFGNIGSSRLKDLSREEAVEKLGRLTQEIFEDYCQLQSGDLSPEDLARVEKILFEDPEIAEKLRDLGITPLEVTVPAHVSQEAHEPIHEPPAEEIPKTPEETPSAEPEPVKSTPVPQERDVDRHTKLLNQLWAKKNRYDPLTWDGSYDPLRR